MSDIISVQARTSALPKVRFRVLRYGDKYALVDQANGQWVGGHSFGVYPVWMKEAPYAYFDTKEEAWAQTPQGGWEILTPDTPVYRILLYEEGVRSGIGYWSFYSLTEPDMTHEPIIFEHLTGIVIIPDIRHYQRYEVTRV